MRMNPNMRQIALQKAVFYTLKGHLSQCERWPFGKPLIVRELANGIPIQNNKGAIHQELCLCMLADVLIIQRKLFR